VDHDGAGGGYRRRTQSAGSFSRTVNPRGLLGVLAMRYALLFVFALLGCMDGTASVVVYNDAPTTRDPTLWPFASNAIWNMPVGSGAVLVPANISAVDGFWAGLNHIVNGTTADPSRNVFRPEDNGPCTGSVVLGSIRIPDDFVLSDALNDNAGNSLAVISPDRRTVTELAGMARCKIGGAVFGYPSGTNDLYGDGIEGGQGGAGLSALGGALRAFELQSDEPIRHALKFALPQSRYYFFDPGKPNSCRRWPAPRCDASHAASGSAGYHGTNPALTMGSLLVVPKNADVASLGLETTLGRRVFAVLRDYGAYTVGSSGSNVLLIEGEAAARPAFFEWIESTNGGWLRDVNRILPLLQVVDNNGPGSVGGGGVPLAPMAPMAP
jgi:hypothetical protein